MRQSAAVVVIEPSRSWFDLKLQAVWDDRELLYFLAWRDLKARYSQTVMGLTWAVLQPLFLMLVYTVIFSKIARMPSDGIPYPLFAYAALVPWTYFSKSLDRSGFSVVAESNLITKIYFPRLIIPFSATLGGLIDFGIAFLLLVAMMVWFGVLPTWKLVVVPFYLVLTIMASLAVSLWLSAIFVKYRDIAALMPLLIQVWMFASPVVYPISMIPQEWQGLYNINPMVGIINGFRWALVGTPAPDPAFLALNVLTIAVFLILGMAYFNRMASTFADNI
ncbi:MAG: ABC transporter permease [Nitrospira sp.]|nr:ABC transporter permease [Nitrospira sp.]